MAKDKKAKAAQKKLRVAAKTEKKAAAKEKKSKSKSKNNDDSDSDEGADLDAILAQYAAAQEQFHKVTEVVQSSPPKPRSSATLIANPSDAREVLLFGGESLINGLASFSNELHVYRPHLDQWRLVTSPNSPLPRSGHAMCRGANTPSLYLFGGEFSSPRQGTFHHYNDFWQLDCAPDGREWTRLETKGPSPSARSGHRLVAHKRYILLFGGFQDTSASTRYLADLWVYDTQTFAWHEPKLSSAAAARPDARSSFSFLPHDAGAVLVGGYSRVKAAAKVGSGGKGGKASGGAGRVVMKPVVHTDSWLLRITEPPKDAPEKTPPTVRWERRKKPVNYPAPTRAGATMAHHRGRGISFGGVHDVEESEEGIDSEFFNQLWAYNVERNRFFPLGLRRPRANNASKRPAQERAKRGGRAKADEEELLRNLALIEGKDVTAATNGDAESDVSDDEAAVEKPVSYELPHPRFNAQLAVQGDTLFIYGGTFERGDREFTFDELWALDLGKMDGVKEMFRREIEDWAAAESDSESEDEDDEDEDEEGSDAEVDAEPATPAATRDEKPAEAVQQQQQQQEQDEDEEAEAPSTSANDGLPYPQPFESLRAFYARTTTDWQNIMIQKANMNASALAPDKSAKEIKKEAFEAAETRWWDVREEITVLEEERDAGGVGEVVMLGEREVGKRR
ncbi:galactose oxidase [Myriangium duriaei CBS 260.36]|uniref:Galactose oxidase n=1 Tax=Myriangium duriaei CBS 260.36 TaxID=1168546 RepID=A0A9P4MMF4_9PEZI|nr:galactose oxidase [Myriangium duriaei CBS 260.36]